MRSLLPILILVVAVLGCTPAFHETAKNDQLPQNSGTPTPRSFDSMKEGAEHLLKIKPTDYLEIDVAVVYSLVNELGTVEKDSKDYKAAQALKSKIEKLHLAILAQQNLAGPKPKNSDFDGSVDAVRDFLRSNLNDYSSSEFVEWSPVIGTYLDGKPYWLVRLKLRAKNGFGALILRDTYYYIQNGRVVRTKGLGAD